MPSKIPPIALRIPPLMKERILAHAVKESKSAHATMLMLLEEALDAREKPKKAKPKLQESAPKVSAPLPVSLPERTKWRPHPKPGKK